MMSGRNEDIFDSIVLAEERWVLCHHFLKSVWAGFCIHKTYYKIKAFQIKYVNTVFLFQSQLNPRK